MTFLRVFLESCLLFSVGVLTLYALRHYSLCLARLWLQGTRDTGELLGFVMPHLTVLVPMHNEEAVAADCLGALVNCDYDWNKLEVLAINDRSTDRTGEIIDEFASRYAIIKPIHRSEGRGGKPAGLHEATGRAQGEILLLFDADYVPGRDLLKRLVAPFCDPEVGAVMGRVVPENAGASLLAALLSLERAAGYQVNQQARHQLGLTCQFGGTVGGVRASALKTLGGWNTRSLTEDTDLTCRLLIHGWKVAYINRAECYEEVPVAWPVRRRQLMRWVTGHTECMHKFWRDLLLARSLTVSEKADALFMLACYWTAPIMVLGWAASLLLFLLPGGHLVPGLQVAIAFVSYQAFGNSATFFEIGAAALLDNNSNRVLLLPLNLFCYFASTGAICSALLRYYLGGFWGWGTRRWHKTTRTRTNGQNGNGNGHGPGRNGGSNHNHSLLLRTSNGMYVARTETP